jgi:hypothetical protein
VRATEVERPGARLFALVVGCGTAEAEELQASGNHLEQHVATHLNFAAFVLGGLQERSDLGFEHHVPDVGTARDPIDVDRQWITVLHSDRGRVDDQVVTFGIFWSNGDFDGLVVLFDTRSELLRGGRIGVVQTDPGQSDACQ